MGGRPTMRAETREQLLACYESAIGDTVFDEQWRDSLCAELRIVRDGTDAEARAAIPWCWDEDGGDERYYRLRALLRGEPCTERRTITVEAYRDADGKPTCVQQPDINRTKCPLFVIGGWCGYVRRFTTDHKPCCGCPVWGDEVAR